MNTTSFKTPNNGIPRNPLGLRPGAGFMRPRVLALWSIDLQHGPGLFVTAQLPGRIRRFWRAAPSYTGGPPPFSWTANSFNPDPRIGGPVSTKLNWLQQSPLSGILHYGNQQSRPMTRAHLAPSISGAKPRQRYAGNMARNRPVLRVRIPSYGSRVPALNSGGTGTLE